MIPSVFFGPEMVADPYPVYRELRETDPVHWHEPFGAWLLTRYDDVNSVLHDPRFSAERTRKMRSMAGGAGLDTFFNFLSSRMIFADPPRHTRLRGLVSKAFTPHAIEAMRPHIQSLVEDFLKPGEKNGRLEIIDDLAYPLPVTVILEMLGLPVADRERLKHWSDEFFLYFAKDPSQVKPEEYQRAMNAVTAEIEYFRAAVARLHGHPGENLLSAMLHAEEAGDRLTEEELFANTNLLLTAGHETTTSLIGNGTRALLLFPDQLEKLRRDPSLLPGAVEEFLRFDSPVQFTHRLAGEDVVLRGQTIRKGQFVYLLLGAANRDPARFQDPDKLDISRRDNHHVAFGQGWHYCLGAPLARLEGQIAFATLLRKFPRLRLETDRLEYRETFNLRCLKVLSVQVS